MRGDLALEERHGVAAALLAEVVEREAGPLPGMHRSATLKVRKRERRLSVPSVRRAEEREERRVLAERQQLDVAERPALRREVEREDPDLGDERVGHSVLLRWAREHPEQGDDEVDAEVRLEVRVRLAPAHRRNRVCIEVAGRSVVDVRRDVERLRRKRSSRTDLIPRNTTNRSHRMRMRGQLIDRQRHVFGAAGLGQDSAASLVERYTAAQVGQRKRALTIAAVARSDQLEERLVLRDRKQLSVAEHPPGRSKVPGEHPDLSNVWLCHVLVSSVRRREDALESDAI